VAGTGTFTGAAGTRISVANNQSTLAATGGAALALQNLDLTLQLFDLDSTNSAASGVALTSVSGTFLAPSGSAITNAANADFLISGGTGISMTGNTGAAISFSGGLLLSTGANSAFTATGGGTIAVCDENPCGASGSNGVLVNTLTTTTATALNVGNTTIGANDLEFRSISSDGGSSPGIILDTTGASGGLKVKGSGTAASGGTIGWRAEVTRVQDSRPSQGESSVANGLRPKSSIGSNVHRPLVHTRSSQSGVRTVFS
jgi:hypothetical protein